MTIEFALPELGENIEGADVVSVLVSEGDTIAAEQNVLELETDKAVIELPCPHAGRVAKVLVKAGDRVLVGAPLLELEGAGAAAAPAPPKPAPTKAAPASAPPEAPTALAAEPTPAKAPSPSAAAPAPAPPPEPVLDGKRPPAPAGPATRQLARELGVDLHGVTGSGAKGRITTKDVKDYVAKMAASRTPAAPPAAPSAAPATLAQTGAPTAPRLPDFAQWGPVERQPLSLLRKKIAANMVLSVQQAPQVTHFDVADVTDLEAARKQYGVAEDGVKVTLTALAIKAAVAALKAWPPVNASLDAAAGELVLKQYYHIGIAVDTEHGLLAPVIRDADRKTVRQLAAELADLAERTRVRKVTPEELQGSTFTITNLGGIGGVGFTPIVNYPEVAILGLSRARLEPVIDKDGVARTRLMLPLCLSYDHRVIDGALGARFLRDVAASLSEPFLLLLES